MHTWLALLLQQTRRCLPSLAQIFLDTAIPTAATAAYACRVEVKKWLVLVRLLLSGVPERIKPGASLKLSLLSQAPIAAYAFRAEVNKWLALVRLLLSDVPERTELTAPGLATALAPYFHLTNAVRIGDLTAFQCVFPSVFLDICGR